MSTTSPSRPPAASPAASAADDSTTAQANQGADRPAPTGGAPSGTGVHRVHATSRGAVAAVFLALAVVVGLVLTAFALPAVNAAPRDVPIGVAGPAAAVTQVTGAIGTQAPGAFEVTGYADEAALTAAIRDRDVYGGLVVTPSGATMLTAPGGSPAVAQLLSGMAAGLSQQTGVQVPVTEVVPLPASDPHGAGLATALLPLVIGSVAPVIAMVRLVRRTWARLAGVLVASVVLGATLAGLLTWYGVLVGGWWLAAGAMAAILAAMSTALLGLYTVGRWAGFGLGIATFVLLGIPLSGVATAPEFLPSGWALLGSWLPPGAAGQLMRSVAYFDGAAAATPLLVLGSWFALGLVLVAVAARRHDARVLTA